jgi:transcriptional regulator with XRE-family HTH domain
MKNRILEFLRNENKSSAQFAEEIGVQPSSISHIISGRNNPSLDFVLKMLAKYPALSTDWLIFGKGQMYRDEKLNHLFTSVINNENGDNMAIRVNNQTDNSNTNGIIPETVSDSDLEKTSISSKSRTKRIVCFYSDNTFSEYFPGDE